MNSVFTNSFSHNNYESYISNCDLINKYNVKSVHQIPKLDKIVLELDMKDLLNSYEISSKDQTDSVAQVKAFLILYIFIGLFPYIKASKAVSSSGRLKTTNLQYSLKVVLRRKEEINNFLFSLFVENWQKLSLEDFKLFKNERVKSKAEKTFVLNTLLPADCFFDISFRTIGRANWYNSVLIEEIFIPFKKDPKILFITKTYPGRSVRKNISV